jgi:hypothetical protein
LPRDNPDGREEASSIDVDEADKDDVDEGVETIQKISARDQFALSKNQHANLHRLVDRQRDQDGPLQESITDQLRREAVARLFDQIADSGPAGLEMLKAVDARKLLCHEGGQTFAEASQAAAGNGFGIEDVQDFFALVADPAQVRLALKESTADSAIVEITFPNDVPGDIECVRIDGKWVPRLLADVWNDSIAGLKRGILESFPSETATENFGPVFQFLGMIDLSFDHELAEARRETDGGDSAAEINHAALLDAPMMLLEYLIVGARPAEVDDMMADTLLDFSTRSEMDTQGDESDVKVSEFELRVGKSLLAEDKRVAVVCHTGASVQAEHPTFAKGVVEDISRRFKSGKINVVDPEKVVSWVGDHAGLNADSDLTALGTELDVDYIVQFQIETLGFAEENFPELRRGRAQGHVAVVELTGDDLGRKQTRIIFKQPFESKFPNSPVGANDPEEPSAFKQRYLVRLHYELARLFLRGP